VDNTDSEGIAGGEEATTQSVDRYPGLNPFGSEEVDRIRFFGRHAEAQELVQRIRANRLWVLYGKSGYGKTSLLHAGIFPLLSKYHLIPIRLRFGDPSRSAMQVLRESLRNELSDSQAKPLIDLASRADTWWDFFTQATFWNGEYLATPLLILDQFEEVFTLHDTQQSRLSIAEEIDSLVSGLSPSQLNEKLAADKDKSLASSNAKPDARVLLSLRTEYVGQLQELFPKLPSVLSRRTMLGPLATDDAKEAIVEPAKLADERFKTPPFDYFDEALETLLKHLVDPSDNTIEPYQLQLYCAEIERKVAAQIRKNKISSPYRVTTNMVGEKSELKGIMLRYVDRAVDRLISDTSKGTQSGQLPGWRQRYKRALKRLLERDLLTSTGNRRQVEAAEISSSMLKELDLEKLVDHRLLRKEPRGDTYVYEIAHDSLARTLFENRPAPLSKAARRGVVLVATIMSIFGLVAVGSSIWAIQQENKALRALGATADAANERIVALENDNQQLRETLEITEQEYSSYASSLTKIIQSENAQLSSLYRDEIAIIIKQAEDAGMELSTTRQEASSSVPLPKMITIPAGEFQMGSEEFNRAQPIRTVTLEEFEISETEITFTQYDAFAVSTKRSLPNDKGLGRDNRPVINVSWNDAQDYIDWLNLQTDGGYRLPSEAEWEYAARAGTTTAYWWGDEIGNNNANCDGCMSQWDNKQTAPVKSFEHNPWGLFDTAGNVLEWVQDSWHDSYQGAPTDGSAWESANELRRVLRGGSWIFIPGRLRSASREWSSPDDRNFNIGFRVARTR